MSEKQEQMWDILCELDGETVARLFTDYHGNQLLDDGFREFLQDEGYMEEDDECCENCDECPLTIWRNCDHVGEYTEDDDDEDDDDEDDDDEDDDDEDDDEEE
jgi:hypothetical protein